MINDENLKEKAPEEVSEEAEIKEDKEVEEVEEVEEVNIEDTAEDENMENKVLEMKNQINKLKDENNKSNNELNALKDRLLRISSEYENFRKRTEKEKKEIYTNACSDVLNNILPVFDSLERAVGSEGDLEGLKQGIEITMKQFKEAFEKLEVEEVPSEGEFDPNYHNAIMHIEDDNYDKNEIVDVFQKGFKRGDKVLRFSLVKVAN